MLQHFSYLFAGALGVSSVTTTRAQSPAQNPPTASSATATPKAEYDASVKQAKARLDNDTKICNHETDSAARMQCKRDAQSKYDRSVAAAKAQMGAAGQPVAAAPACAGCGKVTSVKKVEKVEVNFGSGGAHSFELEKDPGYKAGDTVNRSGNTIARN